MSRVLGIDWGNIAKQTFGGVHTAGKALLTAFLGPSGTDAGNRLEQVESPILPDWAKSTTAPTTVQPGSQAPAPALPRFTQIVTAPDYAIVVHSDGSSDVGQPVQVRVAGGRRMPGNGYRAGQGPASQKFSFGYDSPDAVEFLSKDGKKQAITDARAVLLLGGQESHAIGQTEAHMDALEKMVLGELAQAGDTTSRSVLGEGEFDLWMTEKPTELAPNLYVSGAYVLGATPSIPKNLLSFKKQAPQRAGIVLKTAPKTGRQFTSFQPGRAKTHAQSIANARDAGKRAKAIGQKLLALLKKTPTAKTRARVVGAAKKLGALHPLTAAQLKMLANAAIKAGDDVLKRADKHEKLIKSATAQIQAGVKSVQARTQPRTSVHGSVLGAFSDYSVQDDFADPDEEFNIVGDEVHLVGAKRLVSWNALNDQLVGAGRLIRWNALNDQLVGESPGEDEIMGADLRVLDRDYDVLDAQGDYGVIGDDMVSFAVPDPNHLGYLTDGTVDPNYAYNAPGGASAPPSSAGGATSLDPSMDPQNYGLGAPPTTLDDPRVALQPGIDYAPDPGGAAGTDADHQQAYTSLPNGAIVYDGKSRSWNHDDVISAVAAYGDTGAGVGEGVEPEDPNSDDYSKGLQHRGGFRWHNDGWWYNWGGSLNRPNAAESGSLQTMAQASLNHHWGPLIGNPSGAFKNLRYDAADNVFFWFYDTAPDWAKANILQQQLAKAILDYKAQYTAAAADAAAQAAQDKLDQQRAAQLAKQQAAEDAAHQRDMDKQAQAAELQQAQQAQVAQAAQAQMDQQQAVFEQSQAQAQAQADLDYQKQQAQMEAAQQQADIQAQQGQLALLQAHPELAPLLLQQPQGGDQGAPGGEGELQAAAEPSGEDFSPEDLQALSDFNAPAEAMDEEG